MTPGQVETAMRAVGIGWDPANGGIILEDVETAYCNATSCESFATMGTDAGATAGEVADALRDALLGIPGPYAALRATTAAARAP